MGSSKLDISTFWKEYPSAYVPKRIFRECNSPANNSIVLSCKRPASGQAQINATSTIAKANQASRTFLRNSKQQPPLIRNISSNTTYHTKPSSISLHITYKEGSPRTHRIETEGGGTGRNESPPLKLACRCVGVKSRLGRCVSRV